ncbi:endo-beta-N-acetylglucosaminidase [Paenibacillus segetis]|nr:S-layer homology domain-containing protein [Paenibacillus segetis]
MRKSFPKLTAIVLVVVMVASGLPLTVHAGDTWPFKEESAHGQNQPNVHGYTSGQIMDWTPESDPDAEKLRSHVPLQKRIDSFAATQANPNLSPDVQMTNVSGDYGNAFIENAAYTNKFVQYHFNFWQYIDYYSPWHGTATAYTPAEYYDDLAQKDWQQKWFEFGMLNIPNPTYTDAAHKNGVLSLAGIFFSNNDRGQQTYKQMIVKDEDGNFPVAEKMVEMANYFGYDGYFINQEEQKPNVAVKDIPDYIAFMKVLQQAGLYVQWYDSLQTNDGSNTFTRTFNDNNISFLYDKNTGEKVSQSFFFDYGVKDAQINSSVNYINKLNSTYGTNYSLYDIGFAGLEAGRDRFKDVNGTALNNLLSNGVPRLSVATLGADFVHAGLDEDMGQSWPVSKRSDNAYQWMTNLRDQLWWSGPNVNPTNVSLSETNTVSDVYADNRYWPGIASVITERSVIGDTNFYTNFNTGHGLSYYVNGNESSSSEWSNMSLQDVPVTWQWWQDTAGQQLTVDVDYGPKYSIADTDRYNYEQIGGFNGGSSLVVNGELDAENFLRLYKTDLDVNKNSKLSITYNKPSADDQSSMQLGLIFKDNSTEVVKLPIAHSGNKTTGWLTKEVELGQYDGKSIAALGLVFNPGQAKIANYQMNIGQIRVFDGSAVKPSAPTGLAITEAYTDTNEMNMKWNMDTDYSQVKQYNVYVNDIYVGGKYDEVFYIKNLPTQKGTLKVVPVGADGLEGDAATLDFDLTAAVSDIKVDATENGDFTVSWSNEQVTSGDIKVKVRSLNKITTPAPISKEMVVPAGSTTASFTGMPVNGDDYIVTISTGDKNAVSLSGNFIDKISEPYAEAYSWVGDTIKLPMPNTRDWRYLYVYEDDQPKSFSTTYSAGDFEKIIRGRTVKSSLSFTTTASKVHVVMEDYAGNLSESLELVKSQTISKVVVSAKELSQSSDNGVTTISAGPEVTEIELPTDAGQLLGENQLTLQSDKVVVGITPELLQQLKDLLTQEQLAGSKIQVNVTPKSLEESGIQTEAITTLQGTTVEFDLNIIAGDGTVHRISSFVKPVKLSLPIDDTLRANLLGMYQIADNGSLNYLGGSRVVDSMEIEANQSGNYALLEYTTNFVDVPKNHWAVNAIRTLAAKQLIQGDSEGQFQPSSTITRAEFMELMDNVLSLKGQGKASDIVTGDYEPSASITRQEIVTIVMRAYALEHGTELPKSSAKFSDESQIAPWAKDSVKSAVALGLVKGRNGDQFAPSGTATRAEVAQMIMNYLK